jgi:hypothetical protein
MAARTTSRLIDRYVSRLTLAASECAPPHPSSSERAVAVLRACCNIICALRSWGALEVVRSSEQDILRSSIENSAAALLLSRSVLAWILLPPLECDFLLRRELLSGTDGSPLCHALETIVVIGSPLLPSDQSSIADAAATALEPSSTLWPVLVKLAASCEEEEQMQAVRLAAALTALAGKRCMATAGASPPPLLGCGSDLSCTADRLCAAGASLWNQTVTAPEAKMRIPPSRADCIALLLRDLGASEHSTVRRAASLAWRHVIIAVFQALSTTTDGPNTATRTLASRQPATVMARITECCLDSDVIVARWSACRFEAEGSPHLQTGIQSDAYLPCDPDCSVRDAAFGTWMCLAHCLDTMNCLYYSEVFARVVELLEGVLRKEILSDNLYSQSIVETAVRFCTCCLVSQDALPVRAGTSTSETNEAEAVAFFCGTETLYAKSPERLLQWLPQRPLSDEEFRRGSVSSPAGLLLGVLRLLLMRLGDVRKAAIGDEQHSATLLEQLCFSFIVAFATRERSSVPPSSLLAHVLAGLASEGAVPPSLLSVIRSKIDVGHVPVSAPLHTSHILRSAADPMYSELTQPLEDDQ